MEYLVANKFISPITIENIEQIKNLFLELLLVNSKGYI